MSLSLISALLARLSLLKTDVVADLAVLLRKYLPLNNMWCPYVDGTAHSITPAIIYFPAG